MRKISLNSIVNVRDFGGTPVSQHRQVKPGLIFRGSTLHAMSREDAQILFDDLAIRCVIDVRCGWEVEEKPYTVPTNVEYLHIPFYDKEKVGIDYIEKTAGTKTVGRDIACDPLVFYPSLANPLTVGQMRTCIQEIFSRAMQGQAVYQHCSGGKDRTGVLSLLVLNILGASDDTIIADYLETNVERDKTIDSVYHRFLALADGNEQLARKLVESHRAHPEYLALFQDEVARKYGSMEDFIRNQLGVSAELRRNIQEECTIPV